MLLAIFFQQSSGFNLFCGLWEVTDDEDVEEVESLIGACFVHRSETSTIIDASHIEACLLEGGYKKVDCKDKIVAKSHCKALLSKESDFLQNCGALLCAAGISG
jgi:hypothetical protein